MGEMTVRPIPSAETRDFILNKHYAQRLPSISFAFGLFIGESLEGVLTIGKPASPYLCIGICGPDFAENVYELNRLIINDGLPANTLSRFVSVSMRQMKGEQIILVSYADSGAGHHGYIYQATNWWYTGATKERTDRYVPNGHSRHAQEPPDPHIRRIRSSKHRYVFVPNKRFRKEVLDNLRYPILPYPKGQNERYNLGEKIQERVLDTLTGAEMLESEYLKGSK